MAGLTLSRLVALLTLVTTAAGQITSTGATVKLGEFSYFINPHKAGIVAPLNGSDLPSGPYFVDSAGSAYRTYRLYDDFVGAFAESLLQKPDGSFETLTAKISSSATMSIGVLSRLYFTRTKEKPLAGIRIGVKDLFDLGGVKKSNGNRAWYHFYPEAEKTAPAIQNLIDAGAVIVGQQIPAQFAQGGTATADWIDYHAPFNPRGDGYNDAGGSSTGGGASIAAYDWLDLAVGTDTGGSIRGPAAEGGVFGNRPSWGSGSHALGLHVTEIADEWTKSRPKAAQNASINEVLDRVYAIKRWDFADQTPDSELVAAETNRTMFRDWLQSELLTPDEETCSSAIIIYATVLADPVPRNV
ncbi:amidase signature domain-containing protein [Trichoderma pleuroticola]